MKMSYDPRVDAAYTRLKSGRFQVTTHRLTEDVAVNFAPDGSVVGIDVPDAKRPGSHRLPRALLRRRASPFCALHVVFFLVLGYTGNSVSMRGP